MSHLDVQVYEPAPSFLPSYYTCILTCCVAIASAASVELNDSAHVYIALQFQVEAFDFELNSPYKLKHFRYVVVLSFSSRQCHVNVKSNIRSDAGMWTHCCTLSCSALHTK